MSSRVMVTRAHSQAPRSIADACCNVWPFAPCRHRLDPRSGRTQQEGAMTQTRPLSVGGLLVGCTAIAALATATTAAPLMDWPDLLGRPLPSPTRQFAYGPGALQFADLWLPDGKGPFPVVLMVHGGCWRTRVAKLTI